RCRNVDAYPAWVPRPPLGERWPAKRVGEGVLGAAGGNDLYPQRTTQPSENSMSGKTFTILSAALMMGAAPAIANEPPTAWQMAKCGFYEDTWRDMLAHFGP